MKFFSKSPREPEPTAEIIAEPANDAPAAEAPTTTEIAPDIDIEAAIPVEADAQTDAQNIASPAEAQTAPAGDEVQTQAEVIEEVAQLEAVVEPPRPLSPGAFLGGDLEIIEVLARGQVNLYRADVDEWGTHDYQLVAERNAPAQFVENVPASELFPPARRWTQDEREYAAWPLQPLIQLADWQPPANDEVYLSTLRALAQGLAALEEAGLAPQLGRDALWIDQSGAVQFLRLFRCRGRRQSARDERARTIVGAVESSG